MRQGRQDDRMSRSVSLLFSMLVRYPEVSTVKYDPRHHTIRIGLMVMGDLDEAAFAPFRQTLCDALDVYYMIQQRTQQVLAVSVEGYDSHSAIDIVRDVATLTPEEIYLILEIVRERFAGQLVSEAIDYAAEDDMLAQDEMIQDILTEMQNGRSTRNLIAIREDGRVMVFQK